MRARLEGAHGRDYWRSLDELAATPEFRDLLEREFPRQAVGWSDDEDPVEGRRNFLKLMGASLALAGLTACTRQPTEHIMPYVRQPEELIPGRPLFFATATTLSGVANGVLVESHEGRPTKIEGNPEHPATLGACDAFSQASVLQLYDPDRSQALTLQWRDPVLGRRSRAALRDPCSGAARRKTAAGIRILTETITSPTMASNCAAIQKLYPALEVAPVGARRTAQRARRRHAGFRPAGQYLLQSDATPTSSFRWIPISWPPVRPVCATRASSRRGAAWRRRHPNDEPAVRGRADAHADRHQGGSPPAAARRRCRRIRLGAGDFARASRRARRQARTTMSTSGSVPIARDLQNNKGASLVIAGEHQPPIVHALAAHHEREAGQCRQDGVLHRPDRSQPGRSARVACRTW